MPSEQSLIAWPPELRFLVECLRAASGFPLRREPAPVEGLDWNAWIAWAARHKVSAYLNRKLPAALRSHLPSGAIGHLADIASSRALLGIHVAAGLARISAQFQDVGIRVLSFKGAVLSQHLYGDVGLRDPGDIDLLVAPADASGADALLRKAGFLRTQPDFELTPLQSRKFLDHYTINYTRPGQKTVVELHTRLSELGGVPFDELWRSRVMVELGRQPVATLADDVNAAYLFAHGAKHGWGSLHWLLDAALVLRSADEPAVLAMWRAARRYGATRPMLQAALLTQTLFGVAPPSALVGPLTRTAAPHAMADETLWMMSSMGQSRRLRDMLRFHAYAFRMQETWSGRMQLIQERLLMPNDWRDVPLPDRWFWIYYLLRPVMWGVRYGRRTAVRAKP